VIYIPNVDVWYRTVGEAVVSVFRGLVRTLAPTEPVLLLGLLESEMQDVDPQMIKDLFGFSRKNQFEIFRPRKVSFASVAPVLDLAI
jgi:ATPase family AAA domain-containing protein 2